LNLKPQITTINQSSADCFALGCLHAPSIIGSHVAAVTGLKFIAKKEGYWFFGTFFTLFMNSYF
jgi:hypothetical protein